MIRIAIVENEEKYRKIIQEELAGEKDWSLAIFKSAEEFLKAGNFKEFSLAYIDIHLVNMNGIELVSKVIESYAEMKMVMLTGLNSDSMIFSAIENGAIGYILKSELNKLGDYTKIFLSGGSQSTPSVAIRIMQRMKKQKSNGLEILTPKEKQVLELLVQGETAAKVGRILDISVNTVENHIANIYKKLHVNNRAQLLNKLK